MNIVHSDANKVFAQLLNGVGTKPTTFYMGLRTDTPSDTDTLTTISGNEIGTTTANGYGRVAITNNSTNVVDSISGNGWQLTFQNQTISFSGTPAPNNATHWFICDQASGYTGKLYFSGTLNPSPVSTTLQAAASSGQAVVVVPDSVASTQLNVGDWLLVGIQGGNYGVNVERKQISTIGAAGSGGTGKTNVTLSSNLTNAHVNGEPVTRDGLVRTYSGGTNQIVGASVSLQSLY